MISVVVEVGEALATILLVLNIRKTKFAILGLKGRCFLFAIESTLPFLIAYVCHNLLWWISFTFVLKLLMKGIVYVVLPVRSFFRVKSLYCDGSTLHQFLGGPVTIKKPAMDPKTKFPARIKHNSFEESLTHDYIIPHHLSDVANWRSWFDDGDFEFRNSGAGRLACKPFASGNIRDAFYLTLDSQPDKL